MCSHANPPGSETCERCNARLVPLTAPPPAQEPPGLARDDLPLPPPGLIREPEPEPTPRARPADEAGFEEEAPAWLQRLRDSALSDSASSDGDVAPEPEPMEPPDWLGRLGAGAEAQPPPEPVEEEVPHWLAELAPAEGEAVEPPAEEAEVPDWLAELAPVEGKAAEAEAPDWLAEMAPAAGEAVEPPAEEAEIPDWLAELAPAEGEAAEAEVPDWLAELAPAEGEAVEPPAEEAEIPGWLAGLAPAEGETAEAEVPDWLAELAPAAGEVAEAEVPDWLAELAPAEGEAAEAEVPDWLAELAPAEGEAVESPAEEAEIPDWLVELAPTEGETVEAEVPDWLAELAPAEGEAIEQPAAEAEVPDWLAEMAPAEGEPITPPPTEAEVPDWLARLVAPEEAETPAPLAAAEPAEHEAPEWLAEMAPAEEEPTAPPPAPVPDWLMEAAPAAPVEAGPTPEESGLAQAEIPDWLQAIQPGVVPTPPGEEVEVETRGWLAGIAGVIQPASVVAAPASVSAVPERPSAEATLARASLWQELIARSAQPVPRELPQAHVPSARDRVERWLVYAVLVLAVFIPILAGIDLSTVLSLDEPLTMEAGAAFDVINQTVAEGAPVLVVFDYAPAYVGELNLQAEALLHHLAQRRARIMAISLTPEGAGLAQGLFDDVLSEKDYQAGRDYVNLGYLPGEAVGIRSLEFLPRQFQGEAFDGRDLKDAPVFGGDTGFSLSKVSLIVVLTGDANDLRWWVEQTTLLEKDLNIELPLVAAVSAAIEPLVRPYYEMASRQIDGLVVGLAGSVDYERELQWHGGPAHIRLSGQLVGQVAVLALILIGVLVHGVSRKRAD